MSHNEYSDSDNEDIDEFEIERLKKWDNIKHFTEYDYLSCPETKSILHTTWNQQFNAIEPQLEELFSEYMNNVKEQTLDVFSLADNVHEGDFISLIRHHITREYDISVFEEDPSLADPLVSKYDAIIKKRENLRRQKMMEGLSNANKKFNWATKKYS